MNLEGWIFFFNLKERKFKNPSGLLQDGPV